MTFSRRLTRAAALNGRRRVRYHAPFDGTRGSEPSRVAPCPRVTRRALTRRACWDSHHGRRSTGGASGTFRSVHAVPQSARSSAPFDPGVGSISPVASLGCPNRRGTVPDSSMLVRNFASNVARSATCRPNHATFNSHARSDWCGEATCAREWVRFGTGAHEERERRKKAG